MIIKIKGNVIGYKRMTGKNANGEFDSSVFAGYYVTVLQFAPDLEGNIRSECENFSVPPSVMDEDRKLELYQCYEFSVDLVVYKTSIRKVVTAIELVPKSSKHKQLTFDLGW